MSGQKAPAPDFDFRLDADVVYYGEAFVKLEVAVGRGPLIINVPITIDELWMKGKVWIFQNSRIPSRCQGSDRFQFRCDSIFDSKTEEGHSRASQQASGHRHKSDLELSLENH
jgi:hypothetical protein